MTNIYDELRDCIRNSERYQAIIVDAYINPYEKNATPIIEEIFDKHTVFHHKDFIPYDMCKDWKNIFAEVVNTLIENNCNNTVEKMNTLQTFFIE